MGNKLRVLIVDENLDGRVNTRKVVQRAELDVAGEVGYGTQAISLAVQSNPDIVLMAVENPVIRGLETAEAMANARPETPIIVYSSLNDPESMRRAMVLGVRDYIAQPIAAERLRQTIDTVLAQEERRRMRRSGEAAVPQGRGTVITVTGGKGGIGKTVVSVNLALALRVQTGKSVVIVDADTQFGDVSTLLDITPTLSICDLWPKAAQVERQTLRDYLTPHGSGIEVLAAPLKNQEWPECTMQVLGPIIDLLAQNYDYVLIDTAGACDAVVRTCVQASTLTLVITSAEISSIRDTGVVISRLEAWKIDPERYKIVVNRGVRKHGISLKNIQQAINREVLLEIPYDKRVPMSVQLGQPVLLHQPKSPATRHILSLAGLISGTNQPASRQRRKPLLGFIFRTARSSP